VLLRAVLKDRCTTRAKEPSAEPPNSVAMESGSTERVGTFALAPRTYARSGSRTTIRAKEPQTPPGPGMGFEDARKSISPFALGSRRYAWSKSETTAAARSGAERKTERGSA